MPTIKDRLKAHNLLAKIILPAQVDKFLQALQVVGDAPDGLVEEGTATLAPGASPVLFDFSLEALSPRPFKLAFDAAPATGFKLWLHLAGDAHTPLFAFVQGAGRAVLKAAQRNTQGDEEWLSEAPGEVRLAGA